MSASGSALMGVGYASDEGRAVEAATRAITSPLLDNPIQGAKGVIFNVTGGPDLTLHEVNEAAEVIYKHLYNDEANVIVGAVIDESMQNQIKVTVISTGFEEITQENRGTGSPFQIARTHSFQQRRTSPSNGTSGFFQGNGSGGSSSVGPMQPLEGSQQQGNQDSPGGGEESTDQQSKSKRNSGRSKSPFIDVPEFLNKKDK
jgi:cell division protein FtsZ